MHATGEDLPAWPGVIAHDRLVGALHGDFHHHRRRAVAAASGGAIHQAVHVCVQPGHVEGTVLHVDVDVIGPRCGHLAGPPRASGRAWYGPDIGNRLAGFSQGNGTIDMA